MNFIPWSNDLFPDSEKQKLPPPPGYEFEDGREVYFGPLEDPEQGFGAVFIRTIPGTDDKAILHFALKPDVFQALFLLMLPHFTKKA